MIVGLVGEVLKKEPTYLHIEVGGVVYEVFISLNASAAIDKKQIRLHTTHIIREDSESLYGFVDINEKKMFDRLIKLNGVGPKVAIAICSTFKPQEFVQIVQQKNVAMLKKVPGIGPKSAQRILVELGEFDISESNVTSSAFQEASMALQSLGFKKEQIQKALQECTATDTASLVKEALKKIQKL
ncbi:Holliday junction branch migration protein RuvA [Nitratiruptor sp. SB155-2]|uniref:Holliday junction branch migration complex subunit RuvA n=1 Tax=Nitratiruptor sp. (strain SB155-2) TaxID=387092 RepID=RUVA_NITSB|nr:Holliday junction branch migration protein RuvA [Nitratiruptor sp. SB155-2]A6Q3Z8.1 RecName: Full=Holliday junction branch migration complex subunit RuvA [Nitratiruptor sp. SB155-2]BAF70207.1 holliday junction DNA helicase RuvA [Nitratiruptor sp. SB155-2]